MVSLDITLTSLMTAPNPLTNPLTEPLTDPSPNPLTDPLSNLNPQLGLMTAPARELTVEELSEAITTVTTDEEMKANATSISSALMEEDGVTTSIDFIEVLSIPPYLHPSFIPFRPTITTTTVTTTITTTTTNTTNAPPVTRHQEIVESFPFPWTIKNANFKRDEPRWTDERFAHVFSQSELLDSLN